MNTNKVLLCAVVVVLGCGFVAGQTQYNLLWSFGSPNDGASPLSDLVLDGTGNLYGTTRLGGTTPFCTFCGTVFKLSPNSDGTWTETILYNFCSLVGNSICLDGQWPEAGLIFDAKGNLFGTTSAGGTQPCPIGGCGTVFELSPPSSSGGQWVETVLYTFCANQSNACPDGMEPSGRLVMDASGNLYGTTPMGGSGHSVDTGGGGIVFELSQGAGGWTESVLYNFCTLGQNRVCPDGAGPQAGVTFDKTGNLYGTTKFGGGNQPTGSGTVFRLSPGQNGWTETVLKAGDGNLGINPLGTVSIDPFGNLYSTASAQGPKMEGTAFRLRPGGGGTVFAFNGVNGAAPSAGVLIDTKHPALYGTTFQGGAGFGSVFKIVAPAEETVLYNFCSQPNCTDGSGPVASLIEDKAGNLYGTTKLGGANNQGVVFEIVQSLPKRKGSQHPPAWHTILAAKK